MKYLVWCDDYHTGPEDGKVIEASAGYEAAETWAAWHDPRSANYWIGSGGSVAVHVRPAGGGKVRDYTVTGRAVPEYTATPIKVTA